MTILSTAVVTHPRFESFEEYLDYTDDNNRLYELFNGELIEVPPESGFNIGIANFLLAAFLPIVGYLRVRGHGLELEVNGEPRNRYPDLTIIKSEHIEQLRSRNTIRLSMAPPDLVVEVVSHGNLQRDRDYIAKRSQYLNRDILTYWIIDPHVKEIMVLTLTSAGYQEQVYRGSDKLEFQGIFLNLTADEILSAG
ncbi:Uma2 family endonuclease [Chamaesiphon sp. VAR_48_metabat_403]|uniref:Uma2 family endonuclease n=1 Tax=Chamaesiphon sp. VAR_48_metabat_403 TaxID=2964700 RepID=UPI00286E8E83|nr:Uma2 family endonuclease [Chamaesiphon sp. VAR_48_metabat_403]